MNLRGWMLAATVILVAAGEVPANDVEPPLTDQQQREVILRLAELVEENYVETDIGAMLAAQLRTNLQGGKYSEFASPGGLASFLTRELRIRDRHFAVKWYPPESGKAVFGMHAEPTEENVQAYREYAQS